MCLCLWLCLCLCLCLRLRLRLRCSLPMHAAHFFGNMNLNIQGMNLQALSQVLQGEACSSIACVCMFVDPFASLSLFSFLFEDSDAVCAALRFTIQGLPSGDAIASKNPCRDHLAVKHHLAHWVCAIVS